MELDKTQLQWILAGVGFIVVLLIFLWGNRDKLGKRRRQPSLGSEEPVFEDPNAAMDDASVEAHRFGDRVITPDHPLAKEALVDVEIRPVENAGDTATQREFRDPFVGNALLPEHEIPPIRLERQAESASSDIQPDASGVTVSSVATDTEAEPSPETGKKPETPIPSPTMTIALTIMAPQGAVFSGTDIRIAAEEAQLRFSGVVDGLFERFPDEGSAENDSKPVFSMAHLLDPGIFNLQSLADLETQGLLLFMQLPGGLEEVKSLDLLVLCADQMARDLGGTICDERRHPMTNQALRHLRGKVTDLSRQRRMWAHNSQ